MSASSSSNSGRRILKLKSSDEKIFDVEEEVAARSETIKGLIAENNDPGVIPIHNVDGETLERVIDWCKKIVQQRQENINPPAPGPAPAAWNRRASAPAAADAWKDEFYKIDLTAYYDLLKAANYLEVQDLLDETCERVAGFIRMKTPDEVREIFNIENDFTPEELEKIDRAREWTIRNDVFWG
ncbi:SKP1 component [Corchorus capsularis]|uniref:SKP1-like protein n=1 Tax=Corchorus capsularis TaxID=210143 RepID=A0A1R3IAP2_COCAP|nr:SKP1 component [Corchorus capsularis]